MVVVVFGRFASCDPGEKLVALFTILTRGTAFGPKNIMHNANNRASGQRQGRGVVGNRGPGTGQSSTHTRFGRPQRGSSFSRTARGARPPHGGGYRGTQGHGGGRGKRGAQAIDHTRFINKATPLEAEEVFVPTYQFAELPLDKELHENIRVRGYTQVTPIQEQAIPHVMAGRDVVGIANTGTGKTAAFLIPLIQKVRAKRGEQVVVVTPTRELALQINNELSHLTKGMRIQSVVCVGGVNINPQLRALRSRCDFIIGTPGRLKDLIDRRAIDLSVIRSIVLDEADRMMDMGFINDMRFLMQRMPEVRQTLFFSATLAPEIKKVIGEFLTDPVQIMVKKRDTAKNVDQDVVYIRRGEDKVDVLERLLKNDAFEKVIVFGRTKWGVEKLAVSLSKRGIKAESIHGNKDHNRRQRALAAFKNNQVRVLVATDVASRGLDIPAVSHVINFDVPTTYDDYVHRIGRTGRADKSGIALTFVEGK